MGVVSKQRIRKSKYLLRETDKLTPGLKATLTKQLNNLGKADLPELQEICVSIKELDFQLDDDFSREGIIFRELARTTWKSFCRFGDRNQATKALILCWIDNQEIPLDVQALFISEQYGIEIHPEELAQFMIEHDHGKTSYPKLKELTDLLDAYKQIIGFNFDKNFVDRYILPPIPIDDSYPF